MRLYKELTGRGPTKARTRIHEDCVVVLMREGHTTSEGTMAAAGRQRDVAQQRVDISGNAERRFRDVVERTTDRTVAAAMSTSYQAPDLLCHVFVFADSPVLRLEPGPDHAEGGD